MDWNELRATLDGIDLATITPLHDFVLVQYLGSANSRTSDVIVDPGNMRLTRDYRLMHNRSTGNRRGVVVACGRGDRLLVMFCRQCGQICRRLDSIKRFRCACGGDLEPIAHMSGEPCVVRADMNVQPGDIVIYPQVPTNDVVINGQLYTWCHEEQHILAVLEPEEVAA